MRAWRYAKLVLAGAVFLALVASIVGTVFGQVCPTYVRSWVIAYMKDNGAGGVDTVYMHYTDSLNVKKIIADWGDLDTLNCDTLYSSGGVATVRLYVTASADIDSTDTDHLVFNTHAYGDSLWADDIVANWATIDTATIDTAKIESAIVGSYFVVGDTSTKRGFEVDTSSHNIRIYHDTLGFVKYDETWALMFKPAVKLYAMQDFGLDRFMIDARFGGGGEVVIRSDESKPDTNEVRFFRAQIYPALDTLDAVTGSSVLSYFGSPDHRWGAGYVRHLYLLDPNKSDTLYSHCEEDTGHIYCGLPLLLDAPSVTTINGILDSLDAQHVVADDKSVFNEAVWFLGDTTYHTDGGADTTYITNNGTNLVIGGDNSVYIQQTLYTWSLLGQTNDTTYSVGAWYRRYKEVWGKRLMLSSPDKADSVTHYDDGTNYIIASDNPFTFTNGLKVGTLSADADNADVDMIWVLNVNTTDASVTIGGFVNGVTGQVLHLYNSAGNDVILEDDEGTGNQDIKTNTGADITITAEGGATLVFDGTYWRIIGIAQ